MLGGVVIRFYSQKNLQRPSLSTKVSILSSLSCVPTRDGTAVLTYLGVRNPFEMTGMKHMWQIEFQVRD